jgi:hypothetical protein
VFEELIKNKQLGCIVEDTSVTKCWETSLGASGVSFSQQKDFRNIVFLTSPATCRAITCVYDSGDFFHFASDSIKFGQHSKMKNMIAENEKNVMISVSVAITTETRNEVNLKP